MAKKIKRSDDAVLCLLVKGRAIVKERWIKNAFEKDGKVCALGAIGEAYNGNPSALESSYMYARSEPIHLAADELASVIPKQYNYGTGGADCIPDWNDAKSRRKGQVVAAFDRAIARRRKKLRGDNGAVAEGKVQGDPR